MPFGMLKITSIPSVSDEISWTICRLACLFQGERVRLSGGQSKALNVWDPWVLFPALVLTYCMILGQSFCLSFCIVKWGDGGIERYDVYKPLGDPQELQKCEVLWKSWSQLDS